MALGVRGWQVSKPATIAEQCLAILAEGPATTGELGAIVGKAPKVVAEALRRQPLPICRRPFDSNNTLWMLAEHAKAWGCAG